jgi:2-polyprenyl-3-methyl-5-hydroxy-6-metoxy-1,4-benzoquinol methylase
MAPEAKLQATSAAATTQTRGGRSELFDGDYFEAGVLRRSRALTQSLYEGSVFSWLSRLRPDLAHGHGQRALEIGCGYGYCSELFATRGYRVTATDISPHAILRAREEPSRENVEFAVWDATEESPFNEHFALVAAFEVIEHLIDPEAAFAAWHGLLSPGGALVLTTPNRFGPASRHWRDPTHVNVRSAKSWRRALMASGLWADIRIGPVQWIPYVWRLDHKMRSVPLPVVGATLRILATKR